MAKGRKLNRDFYRSTDTARVARDLLGTLLVVPTETGQRVSGMIVETEAYLGEIDRAAHSYGGRRTPRNEVMYGPAGRVYVFFVYGMYYQFNVVTGPADHPHAILIRALEPVEGIEIMRERRTSSRKRPKSEPGKGSPPARGGMAAASADKVVGAVTRSMPDKNLTSGPGKLTIAMAIDRNLNGEDICGDKVWLERHRSFPEDDIAVGKRIGIDYAGDDAKRHLRFWVNGNIYVSKRFLVRG